MRPSRAARHWNHVWVVSPLAACRLATTTLSAIGFTVTIEDKRPPVECSPRAPLDTILGHALLRYKLDRNGIVFGVQPLYTSVRPASRQVNVEAELVRCLKASGPLASRPRIASSPSRA